MFAPKNSLYISLSLSVLNTASSSRH